MLTFKLILLFIQYIAISVQVTSYFVWKTHVKYEHEFTPKERLKYRLLNFIPMLITIVCAILIWTL